MSFLFQLRPFTQIVRRLPVLQVARFSCSPISLYDREIRSESFTTLNKKFHIDVKESDDLVRYIKISELTKGKRFTLQIAPEDIDEVLALLNSDEHSGNFEGKNKDYSFSREENSFGKFISLVETSKEGKSYRLAIPDESVRQLVQSLDSLKSLLKSEEENANLH
jgi:hypothetical protein